MVLLSPEISADIALAMTTPSSVVATPSRPPVAATLPLLRILLAEDFEDNPNVIALFIRNTPCELDMAENGAIAVEKFRTGAYDVVLMDVEMPVVDGHQATEAIRAWEREPHLTATPILALSANAFREDIDRSLQAGCTAYLTKPITKARLLTALQQHTRPAAEA